MNVHDPSHETIRNPLVIHMEHSLSGAAKVVGKSKATIHRAIRSGKLSARRDDAGVYHIETSELLRVFPLNASEPLQRDDPQPPANLPDTAAILAPLEAENAGLRQLVASHQETIADLRTRLDAEAEERRRLVAVLTTDRPSGVVPTPPSRRSSWWPWGRT